VQDILLAGPGLTLYVVLIVGSVGVAGFYSLTNWNGVSPDVSFVGLTNYFNVPSDPDVGHAFLVTAIIAGSGTIITNALAIPIAVLLNRADVVTRLFRSVIVYPVILSPIVTGLIWASILSTTGVLNSVLTKLGLPPTVILADPDQAVWAIAFVSVWHTLGLCVILYLAGLQTIPTDLEEAAGIDGAGGFARFRHITLPLLAPTMTVNVVLLMIWFMRTYDYVVVMTGGGPVTATNTVAFLVLQRAFQGFRYGFGSAIAVVLLAITIVLSAIVFLASRRREAYL
jgi:ABC-type sugar transport system permease subunit